MAAVTPFLFLLFAMLAVASAASYSCPDGSSPVGNIDVSTCQDPQPDGSCPSGSHGLALTITGNGNVPMFTWGLLQSSDRYKVTFQQLFEVDSSGMRVPSSTSSLPSWSWTFCSPITFSNQSESQIILDFFGTKNGAGMFIEATMTNSSDTDSFEWSMRLDDYTLQGNNNLVLFSKYQDQNDGSSVSDNNGQLTNGHSFIDTSDTAMFNDTIQVTVDVSNVGDSNSGYYIIFDLIDAHIDPNAGFHLEIDPTFGVNSSAAGLIQSLLLLMVFSILVLF